MTLLEKYLTRETVHLNVDAPDWEAAVRAGGQLLVDTKKCLPEYVEAMIRTINEMGPFMVLAPGLALVHARPEDGVLGVGLSLITLREPVPFGSLANDPVGVVISFCAVDQEAHIQVLKELAGFLRSTENQMILNHAASVDQILTAFKRHNQ